MQLSGNDIEDVESTVAAYTTQFLELIEKKIESAQEKTANLDLSNAISLLTLDMIAHLCLGESFDSIQHETDRFEFFQALNLGMLFQQYIAVLTEATKVLLAIGKLPWFRTRLFPKGSNSNGIGRVMLVSIWNPNRSCRTFAKPNTRKSAELYKTDALNEKAARPRRICSIHFSRGVFRWIKPQANY
jgi:hypothetical protein